MNGGPIAERVYESLRRLILSHGFRPGDRLDPNTLAERLAASVTPVREALNVLCGEQLVEAHRSGGYFLPALDEPKLQDMYDWAHEIALLAMRSWPLSKTIECDPIPRRRQDYAGRVREVLETMARLSANGEHHRATVALNARLHAVRTIEIEVLPDAIEELTEIEQALDHDDRALLRRSLNTYHRHRTRAASKLVRAVYRTAPS
jgi:DNA-binding GntR family transcriptional regulator